MDEKHHIAAFSKINEQSFNDAESYDIQRDRSWSFDHGRFKKSSAGKRRSSLVAEHIVSSPGHASHLGQFLKSHLLPKTPKRKLSLLRQRPPCMGLAVITFKSGKTILYSHEDGPRLEERLQQVKMENRISSYRLIMTSTRAVLHSDSSSGGSPCQDLNLEDVFSREFSDEEKSDEIDLRLEIVQELTKSEKVYMKLLGNILNTYAEPLRKFSALTKEDHIVLFKGIEPILSLGSTLISKLDDAIKNWNADGTPIGTLFSTKLWHHYEEYCNNYPNIKKFLDQKLVEDKSLVEFCNLRRGSDELGLHSLLYLPVQRIPEYKNYLSDLLDKTDHSHGDYDDLSKAAARVSKMVDEDEFEDTPDSKRMDSIQKRFPHDDLQLRDQPENSRRLSRRRESAPGAVFFKTLGHKSKSTGNLLSASTMGKKDLDILNPLRNQSNINRQYLMEGEVEFCRAFNSHGRYLFLFNDLLLIAKQKTSTTFKLKGRVRVCEMWLSGCIYDVAEVPREESRSIVIGWPTTNVVVTFRSTESKDLWYKTLSEQIEEERKNNKCPQLKITVYCRDIEKSCVIDVDATTEAREVVKKCMEEFQLQDVEGKDYHLWVKSGRDVNAFALIGHENPFHIKMSHVRDYFQTRDEPFSPSEDVDKALEDAPSDYKCQFYLKQSKKSMKKTDRPGKKKSPFMKLFGSKSNDDKNNNQAPPGKLFGHRLQDVFTEKGPPKSVMELMQILFREGPYVVGMFRKSANAKKQKELRQKLDDNESFSEEDFAPMVVGAVLKEYLRSLPQCLLLEELFDDWSNLNDVENLEQKLGQVKQLLLKLPLENFDLLRHLMCVLHFIDKNSKVNLMTAYNLAVCITPSILWAKPLTDPMKALASSNNPHRIIEFMITHCEEVFGKETLMLFGEPCERKSRQDSSTDSDSMHSVLSMPDSSNGSTNRHDNLSIDSMERDMDSSPNLAKNQFNLSRDSGLMLSDNQLFEDETSSNEMLNERKTGYGRSVSNIIERDNEKHDRYDSNVCSQSYDGYPSYEQEDPKPPPRRHKQRESKEVPPNSLDLHSNHTRRTMLKQSVSMDTFTRFNMDSSAESLRSIEGRVNYANAIQNWAQREEQMLIKSESGAHLNIYEGRSRISELNIPPNRVNCGKLVRQSSVTSTPPMSPESKYSFCESLESALTDSSASSYFLRQYSRDTDTSEDSRMFRLSQDDSFFDQSNSSQGLRQYNNSTRKEKYYISPSSSPILERRSNYQKTQAGVRRSFPLHTDVPVKGSGSTTSKEAEDIISSPKVSFSTSSSEDSLSQQKHSDIPTNIGHNSYTSNNVQVDTPPSSATTGMPMKQMNKYSSGLGSSSSSHRSVMHTSQQRSSLKSNNTPLRASHDTAIVAQVRKNSVDSGTCVEYDIRMEEPATKTPRTPSPQISRSESDGEINKTITNSPRPDKPPSYDEAIERNSRMQFGLPLEISEEDEQYQKEQSARAKKLYMESIRKYMQDHLASPSVQKSVPKLSEQQKRDLMDPSDSSGSELDERQEDNELEEETYYGEDEDLGTSSHSQQQQQHLVKSAKDPRRLYEESRRAYEQSHGDNFQVQIRNHSLERTPENKPLKTLSVSSANVHRSLSDAGDHAQKSGSWSQRSQSRDKSPLAHLSRSVNYETVSHQRRSSPHNASRLSYSSSSVSNSSSDTVTDTQACVPSSRERSDSSPVISRHQFRQADSQTAAYTPKSSVPTRNLSPVTYSSSRNRNEYCPDSSMESKHSVPRTFSSEMNLGMDVGSLQISRPHEVHESPSKRESSVAPSIRQRPNSCIVPTIIPRVSLTVNPAQQRQILARRNDNVKESKEQLRESKEHLPWSVKDLRNRYDLGSQSNIDNSRPPPPPYQNPPPFRRNNDNTRISTSSNSSVGSSGEHQVTPNRTSQVYGKFRGGPQGIENSSSEDSDTSSRYSDHFHHCSSSEESSWNENNLTDVTYV